MQMRAFLHRNITFTLLLEAIFAQSDNNSSGIRKRKFEVKPNYNNKVLSKKE